MKTTMFQPHHGTVFARAVCAWEWRTKQPLGRSRADLYFELQAALRVKDLPWQDADLAQPYAAQAQTLEVAGLGPWFVVQRHVGAGASPQEVQ